MSDMVKKIVKIVGIITLFAIIVMIYSKYLSFEYIKQDRERFLSWVVAYPISSICLYIGISMIVIGIGLPVIVPITLLGGFLFGTVLGTMYATIAVTAGVLILFSVFRYLITYTEFNIATSWYGKRITQFSQQINYYGYTYLLTMHWMTFIPFSVIAGVAAVAEIPIVVLVWTTIVGSVPMIFIYSLAGRELGTINNPSDILSWQVVAALSLLALLACVPILIQKFKKRVNF